MQSADARCTPQLSDGVGSKAVTIAVQNLQKKPALAGHLLRAHPVDVLLAQEVNLRSEPCLFTRAHHTSRLGFGTGIHSTSTECQPRQIAKVISPGAELGGFVRKKTTVAVCFGITCVSFHGYNGTPWRDVKGLAEHVRAVVAVLPKEGPVIFAGDFNTWTEAHLAAVSKELDAIGLELAFSWPYPGREHPLDHVFLRELKLERCQTFTSNADHLGAIVRVSRCPPQELQSFT